MHREALTQVPADLRALFAAPARDAIPAHPAPLGRDIRWMFEAGLPDPATFPVDDLRRLMDSLPSVQDFAR